VFGAEKEEEEAGCKEADLKLVRLLPLDEGNRENDYVS
jgi:hypothetical protein